MRQGRGDRHRRRVAGAWVSVDRDDQGSSAVAAPSVWISASAHTLLMTGLSIGALCGGRASGSTTGEGHAAGPHRLAGAPPGVPVVAGTSNLRRRQGKRQYAALA